jgi:hypothetical protein
MTMNNAAEQEDRLRKLEERVGALERFQEGYEASERWGVQSARRSLFWTLGIVAGLVVLARIFGY